MQNLNLLEIIDATFLQKVQDFFAKTLNLTLLTIYGNNWLTNPSNNKDFCHKFIRRSPLGYKHCEECHKKFENTVIEEGRPIIFNCHAGLTLFACPITIEGQYLACELGGQVLTEIPNERYFRQIAKELGISKEESFITEIKNIPIIPIEQLKAISDLVFRVSNSLVAVAYANAELSKLGVNYKIPRNTDIEEWLINNYGKFKRPISSREFEVLKLLVLGKTNTEIAKNLFISVHTVKAHVSSILEKFGVEDRVQLAVKAVREGLI